MTHYPSVTITDQDIRAYVEGSFHRDDLPHFDIDGIVTALNQHYGLAGNWTIPGIRRADEALEAIIQEEEYWSICEANARSANGSQ